MFMSCGDVCHCYYPQVEERKRPSRVSALYRTTVVEGEALVMRKLVVSGIVAAEKTYLTWLTILKEVSCVKCLRTYVHATYVPATVCTYVCVLVYCVCVWVGVGGVCVGGVWCVGGWVFVSVYAHHQHWVGIECHFCVVSVFILCLPPCAVVFTVCGL